MGRAKVLEFAEQEVGVQGLVSDLASSDIAWAQGRAVSLSLSLRFHT